MTGDGRYNKLVRNMIEQEQSRIIVNINDLRKKNEERAKKLVFSTSLTQF